MTISVFSQAVQWARQYQRQPQRPHHRLVQERQRHPCPWRQSRPLQQGATTGFKRLNRALIRREGPLLLVIAQRRDLQFSGARTNIFISLFLVGIGRAEAATSSRPLFFRNPLSDQCTPRSQRLRFSTSSRAEWDRWYNKIVNNVGLGTPGNRLRYEGRDNKILSLQVYPQPSPADGHRNLRDGDPSRKPHRKRCFRNHQRNRLHC